MRSIEEYWCDRLASSIFTEGLLVGHEDDIHEAIKDQAAILQAIRDEGYAAGRAEALSQAAATAANEIEDSCGEGMAKAVFHAVKSLARFPKPPNLRGRS